MPSQVYWHQEPTIMVAEYSGAVTVNDLENVMQRCLNQVEKSPTYFLVDMTQSSSFPANLFKLASLSQLINHPNARWFAFVNASTFVKFAMQVMHRNSVKTFTDRAQALQFLEEQSTT